MSDRDWQKLVAEVKPLYARDRYWIKVPAKIQKHKIQQNTHSYDSFFQMAYEKEQVAFLDLHGMILVHAHQAVRDFLLQAVRHGQRQVQIITGRGCPERGTGHLQRELPLWLEQPPLRAVVMRWELPTKHRGGVYTVFLRCTQK